MHKDIGPWHVFAHEEFEKWLLSLERSIQNELLAQIALLEQFGSALGRPKVDTLKGSKYPNMKELRIQFKGEPWRILFAFDPQRSAILLVGGNKRGNKHWYKTNISIADVRYREHLKQSEKN